MPEWLNSFMNGKGLDGRSDGDFYDRINADGTTTKMASGLWSDHELGAQDFINKNDVKGYNDFMGLTGDKMVSAEALGKFNKTGLAGMSAIDIGQLGLAGFNTYQDIWGRGKDMFDLQEKSINDTINMNKKNMTSMLDQTYYGGEKAFNEAQLNGTTAMTKADAVSNSLAGAFA